MPSTRMIPPSPNQARRKALSFLFSSFALTLSSWLTKALGFSTGDRLIIDALVFGLLEGRDEEEGPNPSPDEPVFFGGVATEAVSSALVVGFWDSDGFWDLTVSVGLVGEWQRGV